MMTSIFLFALILSVASIGPKVPKPPPGVKVPNFDIPRMDEECIFKCPNGTPVNNMTKISTPA